MKFSEALDKMLEGKKVHKLEWDNKEYYGVLYNAALRLHRPDGKNYQWVVSEGDIMGDDWIVLN